MPTTIPYDPSLTLGNICPDEKLKVLNEISSLQSPIDAAQEELDSAILLRRSLDMTAQELINLNIDPAEVQKSIEGVNEEINKSAQGYASISVKNLPAIAKMRGSIPQVSETIESPIDYNRSQLKAIPLAADSLKMDAQYFSFDEMGQSSDSAMSSLKAFVSASTQSLGAKRQAEVSTAVQSQTNQQRENHDIQGTLVVTASCTHKMAEIFAPFIIDVDKGIRAWNELYPDEMIKMDDLATVREIAQKGATKDERFYNLLSGATYGSSFVGMVHVLKSSSTQSSQSMYSAAAQLQASMEVGAWFEKAKGGIGVDSSFTNDAKRLLSSQNITSHISLVTMGVIPTIEANEVQLAVKQFTDFGKKEMMDQLTTLQNNNAAERDSLSSSAQAARTGQTLASLQSTRIKSTLAAVGDVQDGSNKMLDINSLMTAFTDYVNKAIGGDVGVPINYYLKPITRSQLAQMWVAKYLPGQFVTSAGDDSDPVEPKQESNSSQES